MCKIYGTGSKTNESKFSYSMLNWVNSRAREKREERREKRKKRRGKERREEMREKTEERGWGETSFTPPVIFSTISLRVRSKLSSLVSAVITPVLCAWTGRFLMCCITSLACTRDRCATRTPEGRGERGEGRGEKRKERRGREGGRERERERKEREKREEREERLHDYLFHESSHPQAWIFLSTHFAVKEKREGGRERGRERVGRNDICREERRENGEERRDLKFFLKRARVGDQAWPRERDILFEKRLCTALDLSN